MPRTLGWTGFGLGALDFSASHRCICSLSARVVALWRNLVEYSASLDIPPELLGRGWTD
jgi:hypothetical protein